MVMVYYQGELKNNLRDVGSFRNVTQLLSNEVDNEDEAFALLRKGKQGVRLLVGRLWVTTTSLYMFV